MKAVLLAALALAAPAGASLYEDGHALRNAKGELLFLLEGPDDGLKLRDCPPPQPQVIEVR